MYRNPFLTTLLVSGVIGVFGGWIVAGVAGDNVSSSYFTDEIDAAVVWPAIAGSAIQLGFVAIIGYFVAAAVLIRLDPRQ